MQRNNITEEIRAFVAAENAKVSVNTRVLTQTEKNRISEGLWQEPLVGFADAASEYIAGLRKTVHPAHQLPRDVMPDAKIVIAYFVPFSRWVTETNKDKPGAGSAAGFNPASPQWAESYELTNNMFGRLNEHIIKVIRNMGYEAATAPEAAVFYRDEVISHWSFRHLAYAAGLGTFGLNNMLITEKGCSGRCNTVITNLDIKPDMPKKEEACLYKRNGSCMACLAKCPTGALTKTGFDRHRCYEQCLKNAGIYKDFGSSYVPETDMSEAGADCLGEVAGIGSEVCGKCIAGLPCTFRTP